MVGPRHKQTAEKQRFSGPTLNSLNSLFAGDESKNRMDAIRSYITQVRSIWHDTAKYNGLVEQLQHTIYNDKQPKHLQQEIATLLASYHDWADFVCERPDGTLLHPYPFIQLYASKDGYNYLYGLFNEILRMPNADKDKLLAAAFLTEILTIELYNLRLANIGDPMYANYQGKVFRGMSIKSEVANHFCNAASHPDLSQRHFSIPLGFLSSTTSQKTMEDFAQGSGEKGYDQMLWIIHIHGLDPDLLRRYEERYPESVVTSICAMPIARITDYGEREILLRGAFFHIVRMESKKLESQMVHIVEMVMLNPSRDHGTELASHEDKKRIQRGYFNDIIRASRYKICASLAKAHSIEDSAGYEKLEKEALEKIEDEEIALARIDIPSAHVYSYNTDLANWSSSRATWIGDTIGQSFPYNYLLRRQNLHRAARNGNWAFVQDILESEYELRQADWFNVPEIFDGTESLNNGRTLLHEIAAHGTPSPSDPENHGAWKYITDLLNQREIWRTIKTTGVVQETAEDIARKLGHDGLASLLKPKAYRQIPIERMASFQEQLHGLINKHTKEHLNGLAFRMPELSVLTEIQNPELWIPIPRMFGGFLAKLHEQVLQVTLYQTIPGKVKSQLVISDCVTNREISSLGLRFFQESALAACNCVSLHPKMDPMSATSLAIELVALCVNAAALIKNAIETMKKVREELLELFNRTERMRSILDLLRNLLRELLNTPHRDMMIGLNEAACRQTITELRELASKIAKTKLSSGFLAAAQWLHYQSKAKDLVKKLRDQEADIVNILVMVAVASSIKTESEVRELKDQAVRRVTAVSAFGNLSIIGDSLQAPENDSDSIRTWLGHTVKDGYPEHYVASRAALSDAAYWGKWEEFWPMLQVGNKTYGEDWINATRLKPREEADKTSQWTPLHQAVYNHVDVNITLKLLEDLIRAGAFRTLRTKWNSEFLYVDMTALDLAQELGYKALYSILSPVIRNTVPKKTLDALQEKFHHLIVSDISPRQEHLYLPVLEVLTEMEVPQMWFPVKFLTNSPAGYVYRLDGRELVVRSYGIQAAGAHQTYRITERDIRTIDEAIISRS
ncbi:MAG: hypothetical protein M1829_002119 [Trizodia sp. TS-e1964]|nr:MAG: hypothetical protein M1829_002119 [Trizodia sp. TS-e1964]